MTAQVTWPYPCPQPHEHDLVRVPSRIADSYLPILRGGKAQNGRIGLKKRRNWRHFAGCCHDAAAAAKAVELIRQSRGELLMKGSLHTDELMREVTAGTTGLRTARRISHIFIMDVPTHSETLFITDAGAE